MKTKRITLISILVLVALALTLTFTLFIPSAYAKVEYNTAPSTSYSLDRKLADKLLNELVGSGYLVEEDGVERLVEHRDRTTGSEGERLAGEYVAKKFYEYGLTGYQKNSIYEETFNKNSYMRSFSFSYSGSSFNSQNVIGTKRSSNPNAKTVYIGAHIDNYYGAYTLDGDTVKSHGAYDNGTGIATMLTIASAVKNSNFDFNIVFIGFGAEEPGYFGSKDFIDRLSINELNDALLMINLDSIGAGDYLYLYTYEGETYHESFMKQMAEKKNIPLNSLPNGKEIAYDSQTFDDVAYTHVGMLSDHKNFYNKDILVANFFSYNLDSIIAGKESSSHEDIMHTNKDSYETLNSYYGTLNSNGEKEYVAKMNGVCEVVLSSLASTDFEKMLVDSKANLPSLGLWNTKWIFIVIGGGLLLIAVIVFIVIYNKQKNDNLVEPIVVSEENNESATSFSVFGEEFENNSKPSDNKDDVFDDF